MNTLKRIGLLLHDIGLSVVIVKTLVYVVLTGFCIARIPLSCFNHINVTNEDLSFLLDFCVLFIGILLGIATLVATSSVPIANEYVKRGKADTFVCVLFTGVFECFFAIVNIIFPISILNISTYAIIAFVVNAIGSFLYFLLLIAKICKYNIKAAYEKDKETAINEAALLSDIEQIKIDLHRIKNNNKPY